MKFEMLKIVEDVVALVVVDEILQRVLLASLLALTMDDASRHRLEILLYYYFDGAVVDGEDNESVAADGVVNLILYRLAHEGCGDGKQPLQSMLLALFLLALIQQRILLEHKKDGDLPFG